MSQRMPDMDIGIYSDSIDIPRKGAIVLAKYEGYFDSTKVYQTHKTLVNAMQCLRRNPAFFAFLYVLI